MREENATIQKGNGGKNDAGGILLFLVQVTIHITHSSVIPILFKSSGITFTLILYLHFLFAPLFKDVAMSV